MNSLKLLEACHVGDETLVSSLLADKASVNVANKHGWTPLHAAADIGSINTCALLLDYNADVNKGTKLGWTPLHFAAAKGHHSMCSFLIQERADVNKRADNMWTPLHRAAVNAASAEVCRTLIQAKAKVEAKDKNGFTPLHLACIKGHPVNCEVLILDGHCDVNQPSKDGKTPVHRAVQFARPECVRTLLSYGAKVTVKVLEEIKSTSNMSNAQADVLSLLTKTQRLRKPSSIKHALLTEEGFDHDGDMHHLAPEQGPEHSHPDHLHEHAGHDHAHGDGHHGHSHGHSNHNHHHHQLQLQHHADDASDDDALPDSADHAVDFVRNERRLMLDVSDEASNFDQDEASTAFSTDLVEAVHRKRYQEPAVQAVQALFKQLVLDRFLPTLLDEGLVQISDLFLFTQEELAELVSQDIPLRRLQRWMQDHPHMANPHAPNHLFKIKGELPERLDPRDMRVGPTVGLGNLGPVLLGSYRGLRVAIRYIPQCTPASYRELCAEVQQTVAFDHACVLKHYGVCDGMSPDSGYVITERAEQTLEQFISEKHHTKLDIMRMLVSAAAGLAFIHSDSPIKTPFVHNGICCRNIALLQDNVAKIADVGIRTLLHSNPKLPTKGTNPRRVTRWMAPESLDAQEFSWRSDTYMFGMTIYEAFAKHPPYADLPTNTAVHAIIAGKRPPRLPEDVCPSDVSRIIEQCWQQDPSLRPLMTQVHSMLIKAQRNLRCVAFS